MRSHNNIEGFYDAQSKKFHGFWPGSVHDINWGLFTYLLPPLLLLSFAVLSEQNHRLLPEVWETLKDFCLKYH